MSKVHSRVESSSRQENEFFYIAFINENPGLVPADNAMAFLSDDGGESYNRCHCEFMYMFLYSHPGHSTRTSRMQSGVTSR